MPSYNYESLPLKRSEVAKHLRILVESDRLKGGQLETLQSYLREFDIMQYPDKEIHRFLTQRDSFTPLSFNWSALKWNSDEEIHAIKLDGKYHFGWVDLAAGNRFMQVNDGSESYQSILSPLAKVRVVAGQNNRFGFHFEYEFVSPSPSNIPAFYYDNYYSANWWMWMKRTTGAEAGNNLGHLESFATFAPFPALDMSIGHGNLKIGTGDIDNLVFSRNAPPLTWFDINVGGSWISFNMTHGTLSWPASVRPHPDFPDVTTRNSPQRFIRLGHLKVRPFDWLDVHVYEMVAYSNRGIEMDYLHPFNILSIASLNLQDQDNNFGGGIMILRPFRGVELSTEILIDDMVNPLEIIRITNPATSRFGRKFTFQYAATPALRLLGEYNRIDPFVYSHPYDLNAHTQFETALGSQLLPNSDQITLGARYLMRYRSWIDIRLSRVRHGQSIYDETGSLVFNAGENVNVGRFDGDTSWLFLDGDPHRWVELRIDASWEPKRAVVIRTRLEQRWMQLGNQLNDQRVFWLDLIIGI